MKHSVCSSIDGGQTATHIAIATSRAALGRRALLHGWQRTSKPPSSPHAPSTPHPSCCSCVSYRSYFMTFETDSKALGEINRHDRSCSCSSVKLILDERGSDQADVAQVAAVQWVAPDGPKDGSRVTLSLRVGNEKDASAEAAPMLLPSNRKARKLWPSPSLVRRRGRNSWTGP
jgi:hypothetical protein